mgnify:CR=1 FL=1
MIDFTDQLIYSLLIFILLLNLFRIYDLISPPKIIITYPQEKYVFKNNIDIKGYVDPRANIWLNNSRIYPDKEGNFQINVYLKPGVNRFIFIAQKNIGFKNSKEIVVFYNLK